MDIIEIVLSKNKLAALAKYDLEFNDNGLIYLDKFQLKESIHGIKNKIEAETFEAKDKKVQFDMIYSSTWN